MDFTLTQEQQQFADAIQRWVNKDYQFEQRQKIIHSVSGTAESAWTALTELGALALPLPESAGGFDGNAIDMMVVMQALGRGLVIEPYFATVFAAEFLKRAGTQSDLLARVGAGEIRLAAALHEKQARHELFNIQTTATPHSDGYILNGKKTVVLHGAQADYLIVSARSAGDQRSAEGISLFLVDAHTASLTRSEYRTIDGHRAADIAFTQVVVPASALLGNSGQAWDLLDAVADYGVSLLCAEAVGIMEAINQATLEYLKTRQQFGLPIGKFQALQHKMADMFMEMEQARSMAMLAAVKVSAPAVQERRLTISAAKVRVNQAAKFIGEQAVQLHGGMGVTNELPAAHMFKRLSMIALALGDTDHHLARFIAQPGFKQAA
jgi:alkylation response protein AidB-like acyl-CoA dehydrogenase